MLRKQPRTKKTCSDETFRNGHFNCPFGNGQKLLSAEGLGIYIFPNTVVIVPHYATVWLGKTSPGAGRVFDGRKNPKNKSWICNSSMLGKKFQYYSPKWWFNGDPMVQSVQKSPQKQIQAYSMLKSRRNFRKYSIIQSLKVQSLRKCSFLRFNCYRNLNYNQIYLYRITI